MGFNGLVVEQVASQADVFGTRVDQEALNQQCGGRVVLESPGLVKRCLGFKV